MYTEYLIMRQQWSLFVLPLKLRRIITSEKGEKAVARAGWSDRCLVHPERARSFLLLHPQGLPAETSGERARSAPPAAATVTLSQPGGAHGVGAFCMVPTTVRPRFGPSRHW